MSSHKGLPPTARRRVLVVEDEILIGMLLEDMLGELGYAIAATASRVDEAAALARDGEFDAAILDVNLNGQDVYPVADILAARGIPFVFATGYGERGLPPDLSAPADIAEAVWQETLDGIWRKYSAASLTRLHDRPRPGRRGENLYIFQGLLTNSGFPDRSGRPSAAPAGPRQKVVEKCLPPASFRPSRFEPVSRCWR